MIGIFSILKITNSISSQNFKIKGITVPLNLIYSSSNKNLNENDEKILQLQLINLQKWFIYWIIQGFLQFFENFLFIITIIPGYTIIKLIFNIWLILPMISTNIRVNEINENINFDQTKEWQEFTNTGSGLLFFKFLKPWIEKNIDLIRNFVLNPFDLRNFTKLGSVLKLQDLIGFNFANVGGSSNATTSSSNDFSSYLDSSFLMVMNMKNRFTGNNGESTNEVNKVVNDKSLNEEFDIIDSNEKNEIKGDSSVTETSTTEVHKRKGYFW
ncbi:uncharacterized protein KGF55_000638 [Candida pseudojiufengensis]|uniref:uncharacterized protein n=1 Tax=Candida pseudojiufengensis TaxID=497109 RepID=UPI00222512E3|nr:uncharacterized protein KGF55_000638 [Candida pseudojiufengensis]KAI5966329.1 hypothetical protein KGF55_000638 [Candida pseudojiufengensis]